jgi:hypothetical protein
MKRKHNLCRTDPTPPSRWYTGKILKIIVAASAPTHPCSLQPITKRADFYYKDDIQKCRICIHEIKQSDKHNGAEAQWRLRAGAARIGTNTCCSWGGSLSSRIISGCGPGCLTSFSRQPWRRPRCSRRKTGRMGRACCDAAALVGMQ